MQKRIIFHIDVNSAYLSWSALKLLSETPDAVDLRTIPSVVGGDQSKRRGVVLAKSLPAKEYQVQTGEPLAHAFRKCPKLINVPPDFDWYVKCSHAFMNILKDFSPDVEQASIDEAYCDMTGMEQLCGPPLKAAAALKSRVLKELGFTVNIGISSNKFLAKMASDFEKPDKIHTLFPEEIEAKIWHLPVRKLHHVGKSTEHTLKALGIHTIGDLAKTDLQLLKSKLKKQGELIYYSANGKNDSPVISTPEQNKYYGSSTTTAFDVTDQENAETILLSLCETVCARLRHDKVKAACVSVTITDNNFESRTHQSVLHTATNVTNEIYHYSCQLFRQLWDHKPIRLLGVSTSKITTSAVRQYSLFDTEDYEKREKLDQAIDNIRSRFGEDSIQRARFLDSPIKHLSGGMGPAKLNTGAETEKAPKKKP